MAQNKDHLKPIKDLFNNPKWFKSVEKQFEKQFKTVSDKVDQKYQKAIGTKYIATSNDLKKLEKRISALERKLEKLEKSKKTTARKPAVATTKKPASSSTAKPKRMTKAPAKK